MPTYQYVCSSCETPLEAVQSFSDDALKLCPTCNEPTLKKVYGSVGVVFKGSGFYRNDSRGSTTSASAPAATGTTAASVPASAPATPATPSAKPATPSSTPAS
jgi:putative FmdB family regulatory protein